MKLKRNILANYVGQTYVALVGIAVLPLYLQYMGAEAYGLVGFFILLQSLFQLLDIGLSPTLSRESARFNGREGDARRLRRLLHVMEILFLLVALPACVGIVAFSEEISTRWLQVQQLDITEVKRAIELMAVIAALRLVSGLYRGVISGFERQVWLNGFNMLTATGRFVLVIPFFVYVGSKPTHFFTYQLLFALVEFVVLVIQAYRWLPRAVCVGTSSAAEISIRETLKFSVSIAFTSAVWLLITNIDRLLLSRILPLSDYAYFSLAVLLASGVTLLTAPVSIALLPRLASLQAKGDEQGLIRLYGNATQLVAVTALPFASLIAFFPAQVLWAWTGDAELAQHAAQVLRLYALGNGVLAIGAFPYYLQYAKGDLRMHLMGNALFLVVLIPVLVWSTLDYGALGAGWTWLGLNAIYFLLWTPVVHRRFGRRLHSRWLRRDVGSVALATLTGAILFDWLFTWPEDRMSVIASLIVCGVSLGLLAMAASSWARGVIHRYGGMLMQRR